MNRKTSRSAFTLLELLVVIALISILLVAVIPAFTTVKSGGDITSAAYTITDTLQQARTYAVANNTYVWVGFYEENENAISPTNVQPPYTGVGKLLLAAVFSIDGTSIFGSSDPSTPLPPARIKQLGKLVRIDNAHITDVGAPTGVGSPDTLDGRPSAYTDPSFGHFSRISSDDHNGDTTKFPFVAQSYTFYKTIRFSPRGEANINSTYSFKNPGEIGLRPARGTTIDTNSLNVVAIQFTGVGGNVKTYRR